MADPVPPQLQDIREIFLSIPEVIENMGLSAAEYRIRFHLVRRAYTNDPWGSVEFIAKHCGIKEVVVRTSLKRLHELKLARIAEEDGIIRGGRS